MRKDPVCSYIRYVALFVCPECNDPGNTMVAGPVEAETLSADGQALIYRVTYFDAAANNSESNLVQAGTGREERSPAQLR